MVLNHMESVRSLQCKVLESGERDGWYLADSKGKSGEQSENGLVHSAGQKRQLSQLAQVGGVQVVLKIHPDISMKAVASSSISASPVSPQPPQL